MKHMNSVGKVIRSKCGRDMRPVFPGHAPDPPQARTK